MRQEPHRGVGGLCCEVHRGAMVAFKVWRRSIVPFSFSEMSSSTGATRGPTRGAFHAPRTTLLAYLGFQFYIRRFALRFVPSFGSILAAL